MILWFLASSEAEGSTEGIEQDLWHSSPLGFLLHVLVMEPTNQLR